MFLLFLLLSGWIANPSQAWESWEFEDELFQTNPLVSISKTACAALSWNNHPMHQTSVDSCNRQALEILQQNSSMKPEFQCLELITRTCTQLSSSVTDHLLYDENALKQQIDLEINHAVEGAKTRVEREKIEATYLPKLKAAKAFAKQDALNARTEARLYCYRVYIDSFTRLNINKRLSEFFYNIQDPDKKGLCSSAFGVTSNLQTESCLLSNLSLHGVNYIKTGRSNRLWQ